MAATVQELIKKGFKIHSKSLSKGFKYKIDLFASHFGSIEAFLNAKREDFEKWIFVVDNPKVKLTDKDYEKIKAFQDSGFLDPKLSIRQNFVNILITEFVNRQLRMIESLDLDTLNVNPILAGALNLDNETDLIRYYAYQSISRSIVTSVGFLVQNLILYSSEYVYDGKHDELGEQTKWDVVVHKIDEIKAYLEIKSGTNDINKSIFLTDDDKYHEKLIGMLLSASKHILGNDTIVSKIEKKIESLTKNFRGKHKSYDEFLESLW